MLGLVISLLIIALVVIINPFAELLRQKRVKLLFIIRMSLIITTSAIINKLMTKPNMFPPKVICNHKIIITFYIMSCNKYSIDLLYKFLKFTIYKNYSNNNNTLPI